MSVRVMAFRQGYCRIVAARRRSAVSLPHAKFFSSDPSLARDPSARASNACSSKASEKSNAFDLPQPKLSPTNWDIKHKASGEDFNVYSKTSSEVEKNEIAQRSSKLGNIDEHEANGAKKAEATEGGDQEYVIDETGKRRKRQPVEVEKGHFHEFTSINKNKG